jgi:phosphatidylserine decarboxylase
MEEIISWIKSVKELDKKTSTKEMYGEYFFRDPVRPQFVEQDTIFCPADGILIGQKIVVKMDDPVLDIKGSMVTLPELMGDEDYDKPSLVINVFMTSYDVHMLRMPTHGVVRYRQMDAIGTRNLPMLNAEKSLLKDLLDPTIPDYMRQNERMHFRIYVPSMGYKYYMIAIADDDVDLVLPMSVAQDKFYTQTQRLAVVRYGSQTALVLPLDHRYAFTLRQKQGELCHLEAGQDILVDVTDLEKRQI